jgi:signal recognition particle subunit SEC65
LDSYLDKRSPEKFRKVTPEYEKILIETIDKVPEEYGYEFGRWTASRLATYLEKVTGIKLSSSQISGYYIKKICLHLG